MIVQGRAFAGSCSLCVGKKTDLHTDVQVDIEEIGVY